MLLSKLDANASRDDIQRAAQQCGRYRFVWQLLSRWNALPDLVTVLQKRTSVLEWDDVESWTTDAATDVAAINRLIDENNAPILEKMEKQQRVIAALGKATKAVAIIDGKPVAFVMTDQSSRGYVRICRGGLTFDGYMTNWCHAKISRSKKNMALNLRHTARAFDRDGDLCYMLE